MISDHYPKYMKEMTNLPGCERLWFAKIVNYDICYTELKFNERVLAVSAPKAWNSLPDFLRQTSDVVKFRKDLKTHLFNLACIQLTYIFVSLSDYCRKGLIEALMMMMIIIIIIIIIY